MTGTSDSTMDEICDIEFKDVLSDEKFRNHFTWALKSFTPKAAFEQPSKDVNRILFRYQTLVDPQINQLMRKEFPHEYPPMHYQRLDTILNEMGCAKNIAVVRFLGFILVRIMKNILSSIFINEKRFLKLKSSMGRNPVIFLPTHRSYADFILMAFLCFHFNIEIPVVVAGTDFYRMFGMASLLRQCGAMYMRRSFKDDNIYATVFKTYVQNAVKNGDSPFEFFIEGARSRSGKSLTPKLGLLKNMVSVYTSKQVPDITLVPISINYDRVLEDNLFTREVIGMPKPKESTKGLLKAINLLKEYYGSIHINFGEEISLKQYEQSLQPSDDLLVHLAHTVVRRQQNGVIISFSNLLCAALVCGLSSPRHRFSENTLELKLLLDIIAYLRRILSLYGAVFPKFDYLEKEIDRTLRMHKFLTKDDKNEFISISLNCDRNFSITSTAANDRADVTGFSVLNGGTNANVLEMASSFITAQHYANPCYHFLVNPAIVLFILNSSTSVAVRTSYKRRALFDQFKLCRNLFKYEFVFFQPYDLQDFENALAALNQLQLIEFPTLDSISLCPIHDEYLYWWRLLIPYFRGYLFVCCAILQIFDQITTVANLKTTIKKQLEQELRNAVDVGLYYTFSSNFVSCTLSSLNDEKVIHFQSPSDTAAVRVIDVPKLKAIVHFLRSRLFDSENQMEENKLLVPVACKL